MERKSGESGKGWGDRVENGESVVNWREWRLGSELREKRELRVRRQSVEYGKREWSLGEKVEC